MSIIKKIFKNKWIIAIFVIVIIFAIWYTVTSSNQPAQILIKAERGSLSHEVNVTGKTKPIQSVDLAFERSGKVIKVNANVGDKVLSGQIIALLDQSDLQAQVAQATAALATQEAKLSDMVRGTRPEELQIARTAVENAQNILNDAITNLNNVKTKAESDKTAVYADALGAMIKSLNIATNSLMVMTDMQFAHYGNFDQTSAAIANAKAQAVLALLGGTNGGRWTNDLIASAKGGAKGLVLEAQVLQTIESVDNTLPAGRNALLQVKVALDSVPTAPLLTSTESTNLNTEKNNITNETITSVTKQEAITAQKALNQNAITTANSAVTSASNTLASAKDALVLKLAGPTEQEMAAQKAQVQQAQANLQSANAQLEKSVLHSPISGLITIQNIKVGEIVNANVRVVSIISDVGFEMEAFIPEVDVAKVKIGNLVKATLDAYGDSVVFDATVSALDPAETIIEGVSTYKATFVFTHEDSRIKSGMTANIDITTEKRENAIIIPQRLIEMKDGNSFVFVPQGLGTPTERAVIIGLKGSNGMVEVLSGLSEGEEILNSLPTITQ